jgi:hypothetical protein
MRWMMFGVAIAIATAVLTTSAADAAKACGTFPSDGAAVHAKVIRGSVDCPTARRILRRYLSSTAPCSGSACVRSERGWTCASASTTAFPRLASCSKRRTVVAAYSTAD